MSTKNCSYCEAGIADNHRHEAHVCIECGNEVSALDNKGWCVSCISTAQIASLINKIESEVK